MPDSTTAPPAPRPLTAEELRRIIQFSIVEHSAIASRKPTTVYTDRLALAVEDRAGLLWRIHVLTEPLR